MNTDKNHRWNVGTEVVINFGFAKGILGTIRGLTAIYQWYHQGADPAMMFPHEKLLPAYSVAFFSPKHNREVTCSYRELDLI